MMATAMKATALVTRKQFLFKRGYLLEDSGRTAQGRGSEDGSDGDVSLHQTLGEYEGGVAADVVGADDELEVGKVPM